MRNNFQARFAALLLIATRLLGGTLMGETKTENEAEPKPMGKGPTGLCPSNPDPKWINPGEHTLTIVNPNGQSAERKYTIAAPASEGTAVPQN